MTLKKLKIYKKSRAAFLLCLPLSLTGAAIYHSAPVQKQIEKYQTITNNQEQSLYNLYHFYQDKTEQILPHLSFKSQKVIQRGDYHIIQEYPKGASLLTKEGDIFYMDTMGILYADYEMFLTVIHTYKQDKNEMIEIEESSFLNQYQIQENNKNVYIMDTVEQTEIGEVFYRNQGRQKIPVYYDYQVREQVGSLEELWVTEEREKINRQTKVLTYR